MKYYVVIKKKLPMHVVIGANIENLKPSERSQVQMTTCLERQIHKDSRSVAAWAYELWGRTWGVTRDYELIL